MIPRKLNIFAYAALLLVTHFTTSAKTAPVTAELTGKNKALVFTENRGQVADITGKQRPDILFTTHQGATNVYLTASGIYYQFCKTELADSLAWKLASGDVVRQAELEQQAQTTTYRFSVTLDGANAHPHILRKKKAGSFENFYLAHCHVSGVPGYGKLVYENVYPNIDWVIYNSGGHMKYDFVVRPGGNPDQIKLRVKDAQDVQITPEGELLIQAGLGEVREHAPVSNAGGKAVPTRFRKNNDGSIGYALCNVPAGAILVIDPSVDWGSYFGSTGTENGYTCATDASGNIYLAGNTFSTSGIATSGAYQTALSGTSDAFLAKFSNTGSLLWATYYGGSGTETPFQCVADGSGNVYLSGSTTSTSGVATSGAYQTTYGGGSSDAFLAKFSSSGNLVWGTYFGGPSTDISTSVRCALDGTGNIYLASGTSSTTGIATSGAYQTTLAGSADVFLAKFTTGGSLLWCTYYGGALSENVGALCTDGSGDVYVAGNTTSTSGIATSGAYQTSLGGGTDAFLVKFSGSGTPLWGTYYGGSTTDAFLYLIADGGGNVYAAGETNSTSGIASTGALQTTLGGGFDGVIVKFDASGSRLWGTYYGGTATDIFFGFAFDGGGNLYASGGTASTSGIATSGGFQTTFGGGTGDNMIIKLTPSGGLLWGSYLGGPGNETISYTGLAVSSSGKLYNSGITASTSGIATPGTYQTTPGGGTDAFLVQIDDVPLNSIITGSVTGTPFCPAAAVSVSYSVTGTYTSGNVFTAELSDASGSFASPVTIGTVSATIATAITATIPSVAAGTGYRIRVVSSAPPVTGTDNGTNLAINAAPAVASITGMPSLCEAATTTLADATTGGVWSSAAAGTAAVGTSGIVTGVAAGTTDISYIAMNSCGADTATVTVTVNPLPVAGTITGTPVVCETATTILADAAPGGVWSSTATGTATVGTSGIVSGLAAGTATISYTVANSCGTAAAAMIVTVPPLPVAASITGMLNVCESATTSLSATLTGGVWSSAATGAATVGTSGIVTGIAAGTATISYTITNSCGSATATTAVTVNPLPSAGTITGTPTVCIGGTTTLADAVTGGTWSTTAAGIAGVGTTGIVTGVSAGTATISYAVTNGCGTVAAAMPVTVNPSPSAGIITGTATVCETATTILSDAVPGGIWSSAATGNATIGSTGIVTGVAAGTAVISYAVTNSCGADSTGIIVTVNPLPVVAAIGGTFVVCEAATTSPLTDATTGGAWSSVATGTATVGTAGIITGVAVGTAIISYTVNNSCGAAAATAVVTVDPLPHAGLITGVPFVCPGATTALSDVVSGGAWSSAAPSFATVGSTGVVTGIVSGVTAISYSVTNSCGTDVTLAPVTINPFPSAGTITGTAGACPGTTTTLSDAVGGGTWISASPGVATVTTTGLVTGIATGAAAISYSVTNICGTDVTSVVVSVDPTPVAGTITTATTTVCVSSVITLSDAVGGGTWSSAASGVASVAPTGVVLGVSAGTAVISYTVTNGCGSAIATTTVTVNPLLTAGAIIGTPAVCTGSTISLIDLTPGGVWSSTSPGVATVGTSGTVSGIIAGTTTISYTVSSSCGTVTASRVVTVNPNPVAGTITGVPVVCAGATTSLTDVATGGLWSSSAPAIATVGTTGVVSGVSAGAAVITYAVTSSCGTALATMAVTVNPLPVAGTITGSSRTICAGSATAFTDAAGGGSWSSSAPTIATAAPAGTITGISAGMATISYTVTNSCGSASATASVTVNPAPAPAIVATGAVLSTTVPYSTYQWLSGGAPVAGATNATYTIVHGGVYAVSVTNADGCSAASANFAVSPLNVAGATDVPVTIYPNPANNMLHIVASEKINVVIMSVDGKSRIDQKDASGINVSNLASGIYLIKIYDQNDVLIKTARFTKD